MKHAPLMFAALVPLLATAGQGGDLQSKVDPQKLQQDIEASQVIGAELAARDGAQVQDLEISADGRIEAVLIDGMDQSQSADQASRQNASATQGGGSTGTQTQDGLTRVQWDKVSFNAAEDTVSLTSGSQGSSGAMQSQQSSSMSGSASRSSMSGGSLPDDTRVSASGGSQGQSSGQSSGASQPFRASEIIGMEVHLSDAKSFGEVEDVLINPQEGKASALVVDTWEGFDKQTYALPVELDAVNREDNAIDYTYTESEVIALQEYESQE